MQPKKNRSDTQARLAARTGADQASVSRWRRRQHVAADERLVAYHLLPPPPHISDADARTLVEDAVRRSRLAQTVTECVALRQQIDPAVSEQIDGIVAAGEPSLLLREAKILNSGREQIYEDLLACADVNEFDTLKALYDLASVRLAEIKRALDPLIRRPS